MDGGSRTEKQLVSPHMGRREAAFFWGCRKRNPHGRGGFLFVLAGFAHDWSRGSRVLPLHRAQAFDRSNRRYPKRVRCRAPPSFH